MASHVSSNEATEIGVGDPVVITLQSDRKYTNQPPVEQTGIVTRITEKGGKRVYTVTLTRSASLHNYATNRVAKLT